MSFYPLIDPPEEIFFSLTGRIFTELGAAQKPFKIPETQFSKEERMPRGVMSFNEKALTRWVEITIKNNRKDIRKSITR
jgi:hypothetical protein